MVKSYRSDSVQPKSFKTKNKQKVIGEHESQQVIAKVCRMSEENEHTRLAVKLNPVHFPGSQLHLITPPLQ